MGQQVFEAVGISKNFGPAQALQNVSLGIAAGEVHAIFGENTSLHSQRRFSSLLGMRSKEMFAEVDSVIKNAGVKIGTLRDKITTLSGGNQQKVIIARWLMRGADVLFLDEPTRGIDVRAKIDTEKQLFSLT